MDVGHFMGRCNIAPLFNEPVDEEFDALLSNFVQGVETRFRDHLDLRSASEPEVHLDAEAFDRALRDAMRAGARAALTPDILRSTRRKLNGAIPCSSARAQSRIRNAPFRSVPDEFMFLLLKGARHGLSELDLQALPASAVGIRVAMDPSMRKAQVSGLSIMRSAGVGSDALVANPVAWPQLAALGFQAQPGSMNISSASRNSIPATPELAVQGSAYAELFREVAGLAKDLIALVRQLLECFRDVLKEIWELVKEGTKSAWEKISELWDEVKEDVQEQIDDLEDNIRNLKAKSISSGLPSSD